MCTTLKMTNHKLLCKLIMLLAGYIAARLYWMVVIDNGSDSSKCMHF